MAELTFPSKIFVEIFNVRVSGSETSDIRECRNRAAPNRRPTIMLQHQLVPVSFLYLGADGTSPQTAGTVWSPAWQSTFGEIFEPSEDNWLANHAQSKEFYP